MRWLYLALVVTGCASAGRDEAGVNGRPDGGGMNKDGSTQPPIDAPPLADAPPGQQQITLSQTNDMTPAGGKGVACGNSLLGTADNSWYRVFKLSDYQINGAFNVQRVTFYSDYAYAGSGTTQPATIKLGSYAGTLDADTLMTGSITPIASVPITINDNTGAPAAVATNVSAVVPAGSNLIVEIALPDGYATGNIFYIGVSAGGETKKGYIRATPSACNVTTPTSLTSPTGLNKPDNSVLLTVTGTK